MDSSSSSKAERSPVIGFKTKEEKKLGFMERQAIRLARYPKVHFWVAFGLSLAFGIVGLTLTDLSNSDHKGWHARGSMIANRQTQIMIARKFSRQLLVDKEGALWEDLVENVQPGWETSNNVARGIDDINNWRRKLSQQTTTTSSSSATASWVTRRLQEEIGESSTAASSDMSLSDQLAQCDIEWYGDGRMTNGTRLWPTWKAKSSGSSFLEPALLEELCVSELNTQRFLEENNLCTGCPALENKCLPPYSLVLMARLTVRKGMDMNCQELAEAWGDHSDDMAKEFQQCAQDLRDTDKNIEQLEEDGLPDSCPFGFNPSLTDEMVADTRLVTRTSSIFATKDEREYVEELYKHASVPEFDKGGKHIEGAYDTQYQDFVTILADDAVGNDMILATGSAIITTLCLLIHTKSPFLTLAGLLQIGLSFPLSLFVYSTVIGFNFFPFLNFIGVFVVFALGADGIFVAVDKFKNYRNQHPEASTEQVAAHALPDAAHAMLLTTSTTSIAFFGTAISSVTPIRVFAIFSGLLIFIDYILIILILFPCICIYDGYRDVPRGKYSWCISFEWGCGASTKKSEDERRRLGTVNSMDDYSQDSGENEPQQIQELERPRLDTFGSVEDYSNNNIHPTEELDKTSTSSSNNQVHNNIVEKDFKSSFMDRLLTSYYNGLYRARWPMFVMCLAIFCICGYFATQLDTPESNEVRILLPREEFEKCHAWRMDLLSTTLYEKEGSKAYVIWGTVPADTGDLNDPGTWSQLVLDETFDASSKEAQEYMLGFCEDMYDEEFASLPNPDFVCPINQFDAWLQTESNQTNPDYTWSNYCGGATGLPMDPDTFNTCIDAWAVKMKERSILSYKGKVQIIFVPFTSRIQYSSPKGRIQEEWDLIDAWMVEKNEEAPEPVSGAFFASQDFWYFETTAQMYTTAVGSIMIALTAAAVVIFVSSKSVVVTILSVLSVAYVLASIITMTLVIGWHLGFLEGICFAIAIGISVDFVVHLSHAYTTPKGKVGKEERSRFAVLSMGPSILSAGITTIAGAVIMFFCHIAFFTMFATVLLFTIIQATIGSFVFFLTLTNCIGPNQPTYLADKFTAWLYPDADEEEDAALTTAPSSDYCGRSDWLREEKPVVHEIEV